MSSHKNAPTAGYDRVVEKRNADLQKQAKLGKSLNDLTKYSNTIDECIPLLDNVLDELNGMRYSGHHTKQSNDGDIIILRNALLNGVKGCKVTTPFSNEDASPMIDLNTGV
jgi:hypothetical protein